MATIRRSALAAALAAATFGLSASADEGRPDNFRARLSSYNEVHFIAAPPALRGAISSAATGRFQAEIDDRRDIVYYELSYNGLESDVTQAHIHFGQRHTVGGIVVWLCQATLRAPAAVAALTPECPGAREGTVRGTITPQQVLDVAGQGIAAGEFGELVRAIRAGATYANVHTATFGPGEIRGQLRHGGRGHGGHD